jgi:phage tail sheath protein FI
LNLVKFRQGVCILWGDRTLSPTSEWKWFHQRCQMSHYENLIRENFDWIVFAINNPTAWQRVATTLRAFFLPEWTKGALRGKTFTEAFKLKLDEENNTDLTLSAGDLNAELTLKLADTVERFKIVLGKAGIFDAVE